MELERAFLEQTRIVRAFAESVEMARAAQEFVEAGRLQFMATRELMRGHESLLAFIHEMQREDDDFRGLVSRARMLGEDGWTVPMWAPTSVIKDVLLQQDRRLVHRELVRYFAAQRGRNAHQLLRQVMASKELALWRPLLRQAAAAFRKRQYLLVVPALFSVLEGRIAQAAGANTRKANVHKDASTRRQTAKSGLALVVWSSIEGFVGSTFRFHSFATEPPLKLNRNWVLHGRQRPVWSRVDCLMLWQAIHTISGVS
jgi:hypothetical protein